MARRASPGCGEIGHGKHVVDGRLGQKTPPVHRRLVIRRGRLRSQQIRDEPTVALALAFPNKDFPLLTSSPEYPASTSIQGITRAASAVSRTLSLFVVVVRDLCLFMAGLALGEESSWLWRRR